MATTFAAIRDKFLGSRDASTVGAFEALTPVSLADKPFRRHLRSKPLADAAQGSSAWLRRVEMLRGPTVELSPSSSNEVQVRTSAVITIAYPALVAMYGSDDLDELEDVMEQDAAAIKDSLLSPSNLFSGFNGVENLEVGEPVRDGAVWFQTISLDLLYCQARTLT